MVISANKDRFMQRLGRYLLLKKIAGGGMAEIYLGKLIGAAGFEKYVAVKKILPQWSRNQDFVSMLVDEAKIAVQLSHPNIVQVYELAREEGIYFLAMEYVRGRDVRRLMQEASARKAKIPVEEALFLMTQVLTGLDYAHRRKGVDGRPLGVVHRDVSPQNILISEEGEVKLTDFGIAKAASKSHETATGVLKGKIAYMSPEQAMGSARIDGRSDLFSAATVLYEILSGERLFYRGSDAETLDRVRRAAVEPSPQAYRTIPRPLLEILLKALALSPKDRYGDARSFREALLDYARRTGLQLERERLASFVRDLFQEETRILREEETRLLTQAETALIGRTQTVVEGETLVEGSVTLVTEAADGEKTSLPLRSGRPIAAAIVGFILLYIAVAMFVRGRHPQPPAPEQVPPPPRIATMSPETKPESQPVTTLKPPALGFLSVRAIPWGSVSVDGGKARWETPVRRVPLAAGSHTVLVTYAPDGATASARISVAEGKEIVCIAKFRGGKSLQCGK
jgi:serine/threonine protein kinase